MIKEEITRLCELGVATVYEASGRQGLIDLPLIQLIPGSRAAGPARTVLCGQDDNMMVHAAVEQVLPGEVVVLCMPEPRPVALIGELLATQLKVRQAAAVLVDAAVRDAEELVNLGLPVWARYIRVRGANKTIVGKLNVPVTMGETLISPGDVIVLDADGAICIQREKIGVVLKAAESRLEREAQQRQRYLKGELSYDLNDLRDVVEKKRK
jgi:4-hydroxy-4-methyl-2-oxoglutarate aldolase